MPCDCTLIICHIEQIIKQVREKMQKLAKLGRLNLGYVSYSKHNDVVTESREGARYISGLT